MKVCVCLCYVAGIPNVTVWTTVTPLLAVAFLVTSVVVLMGCVCCRRNKGFQVRAWRDTIVKLHGSIKLALV